MTQYKGYYIDNAIFHSREEIDQHIKNEIINKIKTLHDMMFSGRYNNAEVMQLNNEITIREERLHDEYGMDLEEIENIPFTA